MGLLLASIATLVAPARFRFWGWYALATLFLIVTPLMIFTSKFGVPSGQMFLFVVYTVPAMFGLSLLWLAKDEKASIAS